MKERRLADILADEAADDEDCEVTVVEESAPVPLTAAPPPPPFRLRLLVPVPELSPPTLLSRAIPA